MGSRCSVFESDINRRGAEAQRKDR